MNYKKLKKKKNGTLTGFSLIIASITHLIAFACDSSCFKPICSWIPLPLMNTTYEISGFVAFQISRNLWTNSISPITSLDDLITATVHNSVSFFEPDFYFLILLFLVTAIIFLNPGNCFSNLLQQQSLHFNAKQTYFKPDEKCFYKIHTYI